MSEARPQQTSRAPQHKGPKNPIALVWGIGVALLGALVLAVFLGALIEIVGLYSFWKPQTPGGDASHAYTHLVSDFEQVKAQPRSILVRDTYAFTTWLLATVRWPFDRSGVTAYVVRAKQMGSSWNTVKRGLATWIEIFIYVLQDVSIRLAIAIFALPALVLMMTLGLIDGLVQRDIRKFTGGRESSFVYHHAKDYTKFFITGGFSMYLGWPFSVVAPVHLLLGVGAMSAFSLSIAAASFKKYL